MDAACINPVPSQALRGQQKHYLKYQTVITGVILWGGGGGAYLTAAGPAQSKTRRIFGEWNCIWNRGHAHQPEDCGAVWHFDFFPASLMLMIRLLTEVVAAGVGGGGNLHRVWAIWVQFPSRGWKHIDCPLMVFYGGLLSSRLRHYWTAFSPNAGLILTNFINSIPKTPRDGIFLWGSAYVTSGETCKCQNEVGHFSSG